MSTPLLLLISRDDILAQTREGSGEGIFRLLGRLTRQGFQFLSTAPKPEDWNSSKDSAFSGLERIRSRLAETGGALDGVYYIPRSYLTQRRNREEALQEILQRYSTEAVNCYLISSSRKFIRAAANMGINTTLLDRSSTLEAALHALVDKEDKATVQQG